tara:strand:- start:19380 stop:19634 length:255 start_codon:yes stop_codon:yes gene_type:complete
MAMHLNIDKPSTVYTLICVECGDKFKTRHSYQKYCRNPCKSEPKRKPKKPKVELEGTATQRKKIRDEKRRQETLKNRAWLTTRL